MLDSRKKKQILIAVIFFVIVGGVGFGLFRIIVPPQPTPTPDPRANLKPIQIVSTKLINIDEGEGNFDYDFIAKLSNMNIDFGVATAEYQIDFTDITGNTIIRRGSFYILPGQTKYIIEAPINFSSQISKFDFKILSVDWRELDPLSSQGINLVSRNVNFSLGGNPGTFGRVSGLVSNDSDFDLDVVDVIVVAQDFAGEILAVGKTDIRTFLSQTQRGFEVAWFNSFVGQVNRVEAEANVNVFNNLNFLRRYGGDERFQRRY